MTRLTFKHKVLAGRYKTFQAFLDAYNNHVTDWRNALAAGEKISVEDYLGLSYSEYSQIFGCIKTAFDLYATGHFLQLLTTPHLDVLLTKFNKGYASPDLRFGQYVYNETRFEYGNSYNETDTNNAYVLLQKGIEYYSQMEE